jgi:subtilisin family serine protease
VNAQSSNSGKIIVKIQPGVDPNALAASYGGTVTATMPQRGLIQITVPASNAGSTVQNLSSDSRVFYAEGDAGVPPPPPPPVVPFGFDGGITTTPIATQNAYQQIGYPGAGAVTGSGITIALLDTGTTPGHPALAGHLTTGYNAIDPSGQPLDVADNTSNAALGHGTMVTGILAATAPGATIMPVKVLNEDGGGSTLDVIRGLAWAVQHGANVINMSFGAPSGSRALREAIEDAWNAGVILVASAGNDSSTALHYPAAYKAVIAVASVDGNNVLSSFSDYGSYVDVLAPGSSILSTYYNGQYAYGSGTSFAAPFVAGQAALIESAFPSMTPKKVRKHLEDTCVSIDGVNPGLVGDLGEGLINVLASLSR